MSGTFSSWHLFGILASRKGDDRTSRIVRWRPSGARQRLRSVHANAYEPIHANKIQCNAKVIHQDGRVRFLK